MSFLSLLQFKDILDIIFVALLIYFILVFIKQSKSFVVAYGAAIYLLIIYFARTLSLTLTREIFQILSTVFLLVFIVIFQRELRRFFDWIFISTRRLTHRKQRTISNEVSFLIIKAAQEMAAKKIGALIVLPGELPLEGVIEGGFPLDGRVSLPLILSIFDPTSPGHDGAMVIDNNRVKKFGVHLPLADHFSGFEKTGTRHRAAVGVTQRTDALVIVVSEERGEISVASRGEIEKIENVHVLEEQISKFISVAQEPEFSHFWRVFLVRNWWLKALSIVLALILRLVL